MKTIQCIAVVLTPVFGAASNGSAQTPSRVEFNRDVRPVLAEYCFHCHGPDPGTRKANLRLDTEAGFFAKAESGDSPIVKGNSAASPLYKRLVSLDKDELMPPPKSHKELKPAQIALLKSWIEQGAPWQAHWSLIVPTRPAVPGVQTSDWPKNNVDRFVLARLEHAALKPAQQADARTLIRRLSLDLTGLPPTPAFVAKHLPENGGLLTDANVDAIIDELMALPAYGEHRARYWLDAARYADTHGLHFDKPREMWPYRDWVVKSFNTNQPFDAFTVEQIAGDLLPNPTDDQRIATGLQRCNITTNEGGTIDDENLANYAADRVQTLGWVYMGLTTNCAQCHDHKFDPITQRDYYSLAAFFRNTTQKAKDGNVKDGLGPVLALPAAEDKPRWTALPGEINEAQAQLKNFRSTVRPEFETWASSVKPEDLNQDVPSAGLVGHFPLNEGAGVPAGATSTGEIVWKTDGKLGAAPELSKGATLEVGDVGNFSTMQPFSVGAWIRTPKLDSAGAIVARMDDARSSQGWSLFHTSRNFGVHIISKWPGDAIRVTSAAVTVRQGVWQHVLFTYDGKGKASGIKLYIDGVPSELKLEIDKLTTASQASTPTRIGQRSHSEFLLNAAVQDVRLYERQLGAEEANAIVKVPPLQQMFAANPAGQKEKNALFEHYLAHRHDGFKTTNARLASLTAEQSAIKARSPITHIQEERPNMQPMANILMRGAYDKPGEEVGAAVPAAMGALPADAPKNRLGLAQWLVSPQNPLTARVTVNRIWQELFGSGLVKTAEDFGIMGSAPTHPELLDWLAVEFRESGWDVKKLYRLLLRSAAYRQASVITPEKLEKDRDNALLSRGPRFRMDAEMLRDYALATSGLLSVRMGGPGTMPYQPENIWEVVGLGTEKYKQDSGENLYRRTLYNFWKRMAPPASLELFNAPSRETSCVRRDRTNTPIQALVTMNDPQFVEAARVLAQNCLQTAADDEARMRAAVEKLLCRQPSPAEKTILQASLASLKTHYSKNAADADALLAVGESKPDPSLPKPDLAAWTMVCNQLLNLDEVLNK
jgi:hypothetical protein